MSDDVRVRGAASPEEIAVVLAVVRPRGDASDSEPYRRWRQQRIEALRRTSRAD